MEALAKSLDTPLEDNVFYQLGFSAYNARRLLAHAIETNEWVNSGPPGVREYRKGIARQRFLELTKEIDAREREWNQ